MHCTVLLQLVDAVCCYNLWMHFAVTTCGCTLLLQLVDAAWGCHFPTHGVSVLSACTTRRGEIKQDAGQANQDGVNKAGPG